MFLHNRKISIFIGALDGSILPSDNFIASRAYYHDALIWCVQKATPLPFWRNFFRVCNDPIILSTYAFMCFSVVFMAYFLQQFEDLQPKWDWYRLTLAGTSPCFGMPSVYKPKILPNRIFFIACVFGAMLVSIVCNCITILILTKPIFDDQIGTLHEIIENGFNLSGDSIVLQHLKQHNQVNFK